MHGTNYAHYMSISLNGMRAEVYMVCVQRTIVWYACRGLYGMRAEVYMVCVQRTIWYACRGIY